MEVPDPGSPIDVGLIVAVTPAGMPLALSAMAELKPPESAVLIVELPLAPCATETDVGEALSVKPGTGVAVTVSVMVAAWVMLPPVPLTVIVKVPVAVPEATASVTAEVPAPGAAIDVGLKLTVTPAGAPLAVSAMAESNPPETAVVIVELPLEPITTETAVGEAASV